MPAVPPTRALNVLATDGGYGCDDDAGKRRRVDVVDEGLGEGKDQALELPDCVEVTDALGHHLLDGA